MMRLHPASLFSRGSKCVFAGLILQGLAFVQKAKTADSPPLLESAFQVVSLDVNHAVNQLLAAGDHTSVTARPGQVFTVSTIYPAGSVPGEVIVDALDGGKIDGQSYRKIKPDVVGKVSFVFTAGQNPGGYQVELRSTQGRAALSFTVEVP